MTRILLTGPEVCGDEDCTVEKCKPQFTDSLIAPDGTFYRVPCVGHDHAAEIHGATNTDQLEREGWLHFSLEYQSLIVNFSGMSRWEMTQAQLNVLWDILEDAERLQKQWRDSFGKAQCATLRRMLNEQVIRD